MIKTWIVNNATLLLVLGVAVIILMFGTAMSNSPMIKFDKYVYSNVPDIKIWLEKSCQPSASSTSLWDCEAKLRLKDGSTVKLSVTCPGAFSTNSCLER